MERKLEYETMLNFFFGGCQISKMSITEQGATKILGYKYPKL